MQIDDFMLYSDPEEEEEEVSGTDEAPHVGQLSQNNNVKAFAQVKKI